MLYLVDTFYHNIQFFPKIVVRVPKRKNLGGFHLCKEKGTSDNSK